MTTLLSKKQSAFYILGVFPSATADQIRANYLKRLRMLKPYRRNKSLDPNQRAIVNETLEELNEAYAQLRPNHQNRAAQIKASESVYEHAVSEIELADKPLSYSENAERAVQSFQRLRTGLDNEDAKTMFVKLIAARGFDK